MGGAALEPDNVHGTAVVLGGKAALLRGPSGVGKSDLALRCLGVGVSHLISESPFLVGDDRLILRRVGAHVEASAPPILLGKLEVRGIGILAVPHVAKARLALIVDLVAATSAIERMPEVAEEMVCGVVLPRMSLHPFEASAAVKLLVALSGVA